MRLKRECLYNHTSHGVHGSEFIIKQPNIKPIPWLVTFTILSMLAYSIKLHHQDQQLLLCCLALLMMILIIRLYRKVTAESVIVLTSIGIQVTRHFGFGHRSTEFIDASNISDVVINEGINMQKIVCYLAILLKTETEDEVSSVYPLFTHSWPPLSTLKEIYQIVQQKLFADRSKKTL